MYRSRWIGALAGALTFLAPAAAEPFFKPNQIINVREEGKPPRRCKVLSCWSEKDGTRVCQAQALDNGEKMTIIEPKPSGDGKPVRHILHGQPQAKAGEAWGKVDKWSAEDAQKAEAASEKAVANVGPPAARPGVADPLAHPEKYTKVGGIATSEPPLARQRPTVISASGQGPAKEP